MQRLLPAPPANLDDAVLDDDDLREAYAVPSPATWRDGRWVRANFVMSLDGAISGPGGLSQPLGTEADRRVFALARAMSDVVLVGAGTLRAEDYRPSPRPVAIVTRSLELTPRLRMFADRGPEHVRPMVMTSERAAHSAPDWLREQADVIACGDEGVDLHQVIGILVAMRLPRILCEGGPALLTDLLAADLVDEILLTLSPRLVGGPAHLVKRAAGLTPPARWSPALVLEHEGTVLTQYRRP